MLGLFNDFTPKFVKRYAELGSVATDAVSRWATDVREKRFPDDEQTYA